MKKRSHSLYQADLWPRCAPSATAPTCLRLPSLKNYLTLSGHSGFSCLILLTKYTGLLINPTFWLTIQMLTIYIICEVSSGALTNSLCYISCNTIDFKNIMYLTPQFHRWGDHLRSDGSIFKSNVFDIYNESSGFVKYCHKSVVFIRKAFNNWKFTKELWTAWAHCRCHDQVKVRLNLPHPPTWTTETGNFSLKGSKSPSFTSCYNMNGTTERE